MGGRCSERKIRLFSELEGGQVVFSESVHSMSTNRWMGYHYSFGWWDYTMGTNRENDGNLFDKRHLAIEITTVLTSNEVIKRINDNLSFITNFFRVINLSPITIIYHHFYHLPLKKNYG